MTAKRHISKLIIYSVLIGNVYEASYNSDGTLHKYIREWCPLLTDAAPDDVMRTRDNGSCVLSADVLSTKRSIIL